MKRTATEADLHDYFWTLVDRRGPFPAPSTGVKSRCWIWTGTVTDQGYGRFRADGTMYQVSRYAWRDKGKPDPGKLTVSSRCGNKLCVRHIRVRSRKEIMASIPKLQRHGEDSHLARLTSRQVLTLRKLYSQGNVTQAALAERFGVSVAHAKNILAKRAWKHI